MHVHMYSEDVRGCGRVRIWLGRDLMGHALLVDGGVPKLRIIYNTTFFHTSFEGFQILTQTILTQPEFNYLPYLCNYAFLGTSYHKFFFIEYPTTMLLKFTIDLFGEREREDMISPIPIYKTYKLQKKKKKNSHWKPLHILRKCLTI